MTYYLLNWKPYTTSAYDVHFRKLFTDYKTAKKYAVDHITELNDNGNYTKGKIEVGSIEKYHNDDGTEEFTFYIEYPKNCHKESVLVKIEELKVM